MTDRLSPLLDYGKRGRSCRGGFWTTKPCAICGTPFDVKQKPWKPPNKRKCCSTQCTIKYRAVAQKERMKQWYIEHREERIKLQKQYHVNHRDSDNERSRKYREKHPEKYRETYRRNNLKHNIMRWASDMVTADLDSMNQRWRL